MAGAYRPNPLRIRAHATRPDRRNRDSGITGRREGAAGSRASLRHDLSSDFSPRVGDGVDICIGFAVLHRLD